MFTDPQHTGLVSTDDDKKVSQTSEKDSGEKRWLLAEELGQYLHYDPEVSFRNMGFVCLIGAKFNFFSVFILFSFQIDYSDRLLMI